MSSYKKEAPETIQTMFNRIAKRYALGNAIISLGTHKIWNRALINAIYKQKNANTLLDLCAGTGDISLPYLKEKKSPTKAYLLDFSREMLSCAKERAKKISAQHEIHFLEADAAAIPLPTNSVACATVAYGVRNIHERVKAFQETYRVLEPGGTFGILELTRPKNRLLGTFHHLYLKMALPLLGRLVLKDADAYRYLSSSIEQFVEPSQLVEELKSCGFSSIKTRALFGGVATLIVSVKNS